MIKKIQSLISTEIIYVYNKTFTKYKVIKTRINAWLHPVCHFTFKVLRNGDVCSTEKERERKKERKSYIEVVALLFINGIARQ